MCTSHVSYSTVRPQAAGLHIRLCPIRKQKPRYNFKEGKLHIKIVKLWSESNYRNVKRTLGLNITVQRKPKLAGECLPEVGFRPQWRVSNPMTGSALDRGEIGQFAQAEVYPQLLSKSEQPSMLQVSQQWCIIAGTRLGCVMWGEIPESSPQRWTETVRSLWHCALAVWLGQSTHAHTTDQSYSRISRSQHSDMIPFSYNDPQCSLLTVLHWTH